MGSDSDENYDPLNPLVDNSREVDRGEDFGKTLWQIFWYAIGVCALGITFLVTGIR